MCINTSNMKEKSSEWLTFSSNSPKKFSYYMFCIPSWVVSEIAMHLLNGVSQAVSYPKALYLIGEFPQSDELLDTDLYPTKRCVSDGRLHPVASKDLRCWWLYFSLLICILGVFFDDCSKAVHPKILH